MKTVLIDVSGVVVPSDRIVRVSKGNSEEVRWIAQGNGGPWRITFDKTSSGSPFSATTFDVPKAGTRTTAGGPLAGVVGASYQYNVRDPGNKNTDDPDVDVDP